jgi:hypothetical protein
MHSDRRAACRATCCAAAAFLLLMSAQPVCAQILYGSIVGKVTDPSGAAVAGAAVSVTNKDTGVSREVVTDSSGNYEIPNVPTGAYDLKVTAPGFSAALRTGVPVSINNITRADMSLKLGAITETIDVTVEAPVLQTDRAEVRQQVTTKELVDLPVPLGRNYQQVFRALPGFTPPENAHSIPTNPSRALTFSVNGASRSSNNTRLDGASSAHIQLPHVVAYVPSLEAIDTVNVVTNSFDAEQGLAGGAAVNVQIKSGSNDLHGSAFEYHTNQHLKAKPFFTPSGFEKPKLVYNQFGGTFGGPIKKNKLFYFASYEGTLDRRNAERRVTVPTAAMKAGDMSASDRPIYDPLTGDERGAGRTAFPDGQVPSDRQSAITGKIVSLIPDPNLSGLSNNYYVSAPFIFDRNTLDTKVNWNANEKLSMFGRFSILRYDSSNRQVFGPELGGPPIAGGNPGDSHGGTYSTTIAATYVFSPNFVADAYYGYTRQDTTSEQPRLDENIGRDFLGIPGTNGTRQFEGGWPRFAVSSFTNLGINENYMPYYRRDPQYQYVTNFNWTKGAHSIRFGFDLYRQHLNQTQPEFVGGDFHGASGGFSFAGGPTSTRGGPSANRFNSFATFLLGLPTDLGRTIQVPDEYNLRMWLYSFYARDRWNVTPKLTLSYGMRWEYFPIPSRPERGIERYDPESNLMLLCGVADVPRNCGVEISRKRFAPRFGIAYRATNTFVVRAGYGITNDPYQGSELLRANYPILVPLGVPGPNAFQPAGRLEEGIPGLTLPDLSSGRVPLPGEFGVGTLATKFNRGYIQSWNLTLQKDLRWGLVAQAGYVATRQVRQLGYLDINAGQVIGAGDDGKPLNQKFGRTAATTFLSPLGTGQYNALQAQLERRFSHGLQLGASYTWSKSLTIVANSDDSPRVQAIPYFGLNRAPTDFDRTHNFQLTSLWELPFGRGRQWLNSGGIASYIVGGWQVNSLISLMSGRPFSVTADDSSLDLPGSTQRADQVKASVATLHGTGAGQSWFDPLAFREVTEPRFGTAGFNSLRGPRLYNWDFGLFREFRASEKFRLQFRAEAFNYTNTPHFGLPGDNVSDMIVNDGQVVDLGGFSEITSVTNLAREGIDERQFRLGLRLVF